MLWKGSPAGAFYVLLARERKTPYIINFIFLPASVLLLGIWLAFLAELIHVQEAPPKDVAVPPSSSLVGAPRLLIAGAAIFFSVGLLLTLFNIWRLHNRQVHFRDDHRIKNTRIYRWVKRKFRQSRDKPTYAQHSVVLDLAQIHNALKAGGLDHPQISGSILRTVAICRKPFQETDPQLVRTCADLMRNNWYVQYTTCIRHPWEFTELFKTSSGSSWNEFAKKTVIVDAYTPHFGFTDSVHEDKTVEVKKSGVHYVAARESFAGLHTAAAKAFNSLKNLDKTTRRPTIVIYEGSCALADLESIEQYRIFARHVLSSERMWGGMLTFFIEPAINPLEMDLLRTYADLFFSPGEVTSG